MIDFPNNPTQNQIFTVDGTTYKWIDNSWVTIQETNYVIHENKGQNVNNLTLDFSKSKSFSLEMSNNIETELSFINAPSGASKNEITIKKTNYNSKNIDNSVADGKSFTFLGKSNNPAGMDMSQDGRYLYVYEASNGIISQYKLLEPFNLRTGMYDNKSVTIIANGTDIHFSVDGKNLYVCNNSNIIYYYFLSTAWDVSTATADPSKNFDASAQNSTIISLYISPSGDNLYLLSSNTNRTVYPYSLSTPYIPSTSLIQPNTVNTSSSNADMVQIHFSDDGTKMYLTGNNTIRTITTITLNTPWSFVSINRIDTVTISSSLISTETTLSGMIFNSNGMKIYLIGSVTDTVYSINVSIPWNLSGVIEPDFSFKVGDIDSNMNDIFITPDGTKAFTVGSGSDYIYQFTLLTPWDLTTMKYDNISYSLSAGNPNETASTGVFGKPDGSALYIVGTSNDRVYQISLTRAWDLTSARYEGINFSVSAYALNPYGVTFSPTGQHMYVLTSVGIFRYILGIPWDITSAEYIDTVSLSSTSGETSANAISVNKDGTKLFVVGLTNGSKVYQYSMSTPWSLTGATYDNIVLNLTSPSITNPTGIAFNTDFSKMYICSATGVYSFNTNNNFFSLKNTTYDNISLTPDPDPNIKGMFFKPDGTKLYMIGIANDIIIQYSLSTPWNLSTAVYENKFYNINSTTYDPYDLTFTPDGYTLYITGYSTGTTNTVSVRKYTLTTPWEISNTNLVYNGLVENLPYAGSSTYTASGTYSWTCPPNVTSVSVVCVGGGGGATSTSSGGAGGAGGGLGWKNNISVTPNQTYTVVVGAGGIGVNTNTPAGNGGNSYFKSMDTVYGGGGSGAPSISSNAVGGGYFGDGGGNGGAGGNNLGSISYAGGGGGAGGYNGTGGSGGNGTGGAAGGNGTGGAAGGGGASAGSGGYYAGGGGGVGIFGQGTSGTGGVSSTTNAFQGGGGSGGGGNTGTATSAAGLYGGGAGSVDANIAISGANGAVRIIWGYNRSFPSTNTFDYVNANYVPRLFFGKDGYKVYTVGFNGPYVFQYDLTVPYNISTATYTGQLGLGTSGNPTSMYFNRTGEKLLIVDNNNDTIYQYNATTPWDIVGLTAATSYSVSSKDNTPIDIYLDNQGKKLYMLGDTYNTIYQYSLDNTSPVIYWPKNIKWKNNTTPIMPEYNYTDVIDLYTTDGGQSYVGLSSLRDYTLYTPSIGNLISPGLYELQSYIGPSSTYTQRIVDISQFLSKPVRFVWKMKIGVAGASDSNDVQLDNIVSGTYSYNFESSAYGFQTSSGNGGDVYNSVSWSTVVLASPSATDGKWNSDFKNSSYCLNSETTSLSAGASMWVRSPIVYPTTSTITFGEYRLGINADTTLTFYIDLLR